MSGNTFITPDVIAAETLFNLENNCVMAANVHRAYVKEFVKVGESVRIAKPNKFLAINGRTRQQQSITEGTVTLTVDQQEHVSWGWSQIDRTLTVKEFSKRYAKPAGIALANAVDEYLTGLYYKLWMSGGTPGTNPSTFAALGDMATILDNGAVPDDGDRKLVLNPASRWNMADALKGTFDSSMPREMIRKGKLGMVANFEIYGDQNVAIHTTGSRIGDSILVDEATAANRNSNSSPQANSMSMTMDAFGSDVAGALKAGDVFTLDGVNRCNPVSKADTGELMQFTVLSDVTSDSNEASVTFAPAIVTTGPYQNVTAAPANDAKVTFTGSASTPYAQCLAYHMNALALAMIPIDLPESASFKARADHDGFSIAVIKDFDIDDYEDICRMDILFAGEAIYPDLGARLWAA